MIENESRQGSTRHERLTFDPARIRDVVMALALLVGLASNLPVQAAIPTTEREVLINLYNSTDGANWTYNTGWLGLAGTECNWYGIACDTWGSHITSIYLNENNLRGTLPALVGLNNLSAFNVRRNLLTGVIPPLTELTSLYWFFASENNFIGSIPSMAGLKDINLFYVDRNNLTGSIPSLANLTNLSHFVVSENQLSGSIPPFTGMANLLYFNVRYNQLSGSIPSLSGLTTLGSFYADQNQLTGPIPILTGLRALSYFRVDNNQLRGDVPDVPNPNALQPGYAKLCPNALNHTSNADWDIATGQTPWYQNCFALPDRVYENGFDD